MDSEQDIKRMLEKMGEIPGMPRPARIEVRYDKTLQEITGRACDPTIVSEGLPFLLLLNFIFFEHPEIPMTYPPGALGLLLNDTPPKDDAFVLDGDVIKLTAYRGKNGMIPSPFFR